MSATERPTLSRREFLKLAAAATSCATLAALVDGEPASAATDESDTDTEWGVLIDLTRCVGCDQCALACKRAHGLPNADAVPNKLSSSAYTFVDKRSTSDGLTVNVKRQCMHCLRPGCASACTVAALRKTEAGPVVYDADRCIGCRYCQYACPFGVPAYDWNNPLGLIHKCEFCSERLSEGEQPACVAACPSGAIQFGRRSDLLVQAHARIRSNPGRYVDHVYGETEAGGTSMLYVSGVPFAELGFPNLGSQPVPRYAEAVMTKTPVVALSVATAATALHFALRPHETPHAPDDAATEEEPS